MSSPLILPHLKPIRFAQNIIEIDENISLVHCEFPFIPTLAMLCEAAAQSSASFNQQKKVSNQNEQIGFLVTLKNAKILKEISDTSFDIKVHKNIDLGSMSEYTFEAMNNSVVCATGTLTVVLK